MKYELPSLSDTLLLHHRLTSPTVLLGLWESVHGELPPRTHAKPLDPTLDHLQGRNLPPKNTSWAEVFLHSNTTWTLCWHRLETLEKAVRASPKLWLILDEADRLDPAILRKRKEFWESVRQEKLASKVALRRQWKAPGLLGIAQEHRWW
jgi:uncharacterized protein (DUF58 family)